MTETINYFRQRFSPVLFSALAVFLLLFAKGNIHFQTSDYFLFPFLLALLFIFRLFDDLQNRDFDQNKPDRNYTELHAHGRLQKFLSSFSVIVFALLFVLTPIAGLLLTGFFLLNLGLYKWLLFRWKFRNILPLLKYPFLCLLLVYLLHSQPPFLTMGFSLLLFPAFLLFESLSDENFPLHPFLKAALFSLIFLPFLLQFTINVQGFFLAGSALIACLALLFFRHRTLPYLLLFLLLLTRLSLPL